MKVKAVGGYVVVCFNGDLFGLMRIDANEFEFKQ